MNTSITNRDMFMVLMGMNQTLCRQMKEEGIPDSSMKLTTIMSVATKKLLSDMTREERENLLTNLLEFHPMEYFVKTLKDMKNECS